MSDSTRYSSTDSVNICIGKYKIHSHQGAASNIFRDVGANSSFSPVDCSQIGKYTSLRSNFVLQTQFFCFFSSSILLPVLEAAGSI